MFSTRCLKKFLRSIGFEACVSAITKVPCRRCFRSLQVQLLLVKSKVVNRFMPAEKNCCHASGMVRTLALLGDWAIRSAFS
jgi:hypothetical protein